MELLEQLLRLYDMYWKQGKIPEEWKITKVISIFKKGDRTNPENYRGISLLCSGYKIYAKIISRILSNITEAVLLEEQLNFRKRQSCINNIFTVKQIVEKRIEHNFETHLLFGDYYKAFDKVPRLMLWRAVSYTHLDVYKRQTQSLSDDFNNSPFTFSSYCGT